MPISVSMSANQRVQLSAVAILGSSAVREGAISWTVNDNTLINILVIDSKNCFAQGTGRPGTAVVTASVKERASGNIISDTATITIEMPTPLPSPTALTVTAKAPEDLPNQDNASGNFIP